MDVLHSGGEKAAGSCRWIVNGADDAVFIERIIIIEKHQRGGQIDDITRGKVLPGGLVRTLGKTSDQLLKYQPHIVVGDVLRV